MRERFSIKLSIIGFLFLAVFVQRWATSQERKVPSWKTCEKVVEILLSMPADLDTTLPAPRLDHEPPYTLGRENTVYWSSDETQDMLDSASLDMDLLFFEVEARYRKADLDTVLYTVLWGFVDVGVDSATFGNLPARISVEYRLRYFAQDSKGDYRRSYWSEPEKSIQDISPPILEEFYIYDLFESGEKSWVTDNQIRVRIVASDPDSGQVMQVVFHEKSVGVENTLYYDIVPPRARIDMIISYTMGVSEHELDTLSVWVIDVANQPSEKKSVTLFWWDLEEMVCFPNPFNPEEGETSTITVSVHDVMEARIFDLFGNLIRVLRKDASGSSFDWDGKNEKGDVVSNGGYLCVVKGNTQLYCKIAVLR